MLTSNRTRVVQATEVITGQLTNIKEVLESEDELISPTSQALIQQSMTIIVMAVKSLTQP